MTSKATILFIDDEPEFVAPHLQELRDSGYEVIMELDPDEAIKTFRKQEFDLIIMDLLMPLLKQDRNHAEDATHSHVDIRETGIRIYQEIMKLSDRRNNTQVPVIFMTVVRDPKVREKIEELDKRYKRNKSIILTKPVSLRQLISAVETALRSSKRLKE